jgi:hypothetical protein
MSIGLSNPKVLLLYTILLIGILSLVSLIPSVAELAEKPYQTSTASTTCIILAESSLTVHVVDLKGKPVKDAMVLLNGAYVCNGLVTVSNFSGTTDSNGNIEFGVVPGAKYNVTVFPPSSVGAGIVISHITAPQPTMLTTTTIPIPEPPFLLALVTAILFAVAIVRRQN